MIWKLSMCSVALACTQYACASDVPAADLAVNVTASASLNMQGIDSYGNWCGGGHGGLQDCCNGSGCPSCNYNKGINSACLKECPAVDEMDMACANHDFCTFQYDYYDSVPCKPQGNYCKCDCILVEQADKGLCDNRSCSAYSSALITTFKRGTSCVTPDMTCEKRPVGDGIYDYC